MTLCPWWSYPSTDLEILEDFRRKLTTFYVKKNYDISVDKDRYPNVYEYADLLTFHWALYHANNIIAEPDSKFVQKLESDTTDHPFYRYVLARYNAKCSAADQIHLHDARMKIRTGITNLYDSINEKHN